MSSETPFRILPKLVDNNRAFWTGGALFEEFRYDAHGEPVDPEV